MDQLPNRPNEQHSRASKTRRSQTSRNRRNRRRKERRRLLETAIMLGLCEVPLVGRAHYRFRLISQNQIPPAAVINPPPPLAEPERMTEAEAEDFSEDLALLDLLPPLDEFVPTAEPGPSEPAPFLLPPPNLNRPFKR